MCPLTFDGAPSDVTGGRYFFTVAGLKFSRFANSPCVASGCRLWACSTRCGFGVCAFRGGLI